MANEHRRTDRDCTTLFNTPNYDITTTSNIEWHFVYDPDEHERSHPEQCWPVEIKLRDIQAMLQVPAHTPSPRAQPTRPAHTPATSPSPVLLLAPFPAYPHLCPFFRHPLAGGRAARGPRGPYAHARSYDLGGRGEATQAGAPRNAPSAPGAA